ncbi:MAG: lipopolysaccharide biosynthesis protein [Acidimicrobiia bacterium]
MPALARRVLDKDKNPLPEGTFAVGAGLVIAGVTAYGFLAISARALGPESYAPLGVLWALMFVAGPGFFLPLEQEVSRALAHRMARGIGGGPLVRRACLAGGTVALVLVALTALGSGVLLDQLFDDQVLLLVGFMVGLVGYFGVHLLRGMLSGNGRFGTYAVLVGSEAVIRLGGCVVLGVVGAATAGPFGLVLGLSPIAATALAARRERGLVTPGPDAPWSELSTALGYLLAGSVLAQLLVNSGVLAVQVLANESEQAVAGRFLNGLIIARVPLFMFQAVQAALLPKLAGLAGAGRHGDFRVGLRRLLYVVVAIGATATAVAFAVGPDVVRILFGEGFELRRADLAYLAGGSAAYMLALALAQALIALSAYARVVVGWAAGIAGFLVVTASQTGLLNRVERGFLAGSAAAAVAMAVLLATRMAAGTDASAEDLIGASHDVPLEP